MKNAAAIVLGLFGMTLTACAPKVLDLEPDAAGSEPIVDGGASASDGPSAPPASLTALDGSAIGELDDLHATALCAWLAQFQPAQCNDNPSEGGTEIGATTRIGYQDQSMAWVCLDPTNCALNLHHSPCAATIASLTQCVKVWETSVAIANQTGTFSAQDWSNLAQGCSAFEADPECHATVLLYDAPANCAGQMPIAVGASCQ